MIYTDIPIWSKGPAEIIRKGFELLDEDTPSSTRIAMILVDNAVELMLQTFISLPKRISGINITRKERDEYCKNFPSLLDGIEVVAEDRLIGINLGEFEWFHRIRNRLYHEGNGLTVGKRDVEIYAELSLKLFRALFEYDLELKNRETDSAKLVGEFFNDWIDVERNIVEVAGTGNKIPFIKSVRKMASDGRLTATQLREIEEIYIIRNQLVHGEAEPEEMLRPENMSKVKNVKEVVKQIASLAIAAGVGI